MRVLVVGQGLVGSALCDRPEFVGVSHVDWRNVLDDGWTNRAAENFDLVINCAGIAGQQRCREATYNQVVDANVRLPNLIAGVCQERGIPYVGLSTSGVYLEQVCRTEGRCQTEMSPVFPHNLYCASALMCEYSLMSRGFDKVYVLRIPWFVSSRRFFERLSVWQFVQGTYASFVDIETLVSACRLIVYAKGADDLSGVYNLVSGSAWFPDFVEQMTGKRLPVRETFETDMSACVPMSRTKFVRTFGVL